MPKQRRRRTARGRTQRRSRQASAGSALQALTSAALALPGFSGRAAAEAPSGRYVSEYAYSYYAEDDLPGSKVSAGGETSRYSIHTHQLRFGAPLADRFDLGVDLVHETMSGATPWYVIPDANGAPVQVMTGASIEETRTDVLARGSYYLDSGLATLGGGVSVENDYLAVNGSLEGQRSWNEDNTTLSSGMGFSIDTLTPTEAGSDPYRPEKEHRQAISAFMGVSQVLGRGAVLQSTLSYQHARGFLSDPYKRVLVEGAPIGDSRPDVRHQFSWLTRYRQYVALTDASLHLDYRFYADDWQITSHTFELAWYQGLFGTLRLIPSFRYYTQSQAEFYAPWFAVARADGNHSSDYRLSPYGALSGRLRAEMGFSTGRIDWLASLAWERYVSDADFAIGKVAVENPGLVSFHLLSVGLTARF